MNEIANTEEQDRFVDALAIYLIKDQVENSILVALDDTRVKVWLELRKSTPLLGYPTIKEAKELLRKFLFNR